MKVTAMAAAAALLAACSSTPVAAAGARVCLPRAELLDALKDRHGEQPVAMGVTNDGRLVEITESGGGQSWTIVVTAPRGESCVLAASQRWHRVWRQPEWPRS